MKRLFVIALLLPLLAAPALASDFRAGLRAYNLGDYRSAVRHWLPLAENHDAKAQSGLAFLYYKGLGVPLDRAIAAKWFRAAARQGSPYSQMFLGTMHYYGDGVPRDNTLAYMWCDLALGGGLVEALECRSTVSESMNAAQIAAAQRLSVEWTGKHGGE